MRKQRKFHPPFLKKLTLFHKQISSHKHLDRYIFIFSVFIILLGKFIQFPSLTYHAEMFAENATNFFITAYAKDLFTNILTLDAGYLPLLQRLIAIVLVKGFGLVELYPFYSQIFAVLFIAVMSSLINLKEFKFFKLPTAILFILGLAIGFISDYELNAFINFVYYGVVLLFFLIFVNKEKISITKLFFLVAISSLIILSKGQFIVFLPIYFILLVGHFLRREIRSIAYYAITILAGMLQLVILLFNTDAKTELARVPYLLLKVAYYYLLTYEHVFFGYVVKDGAGFLSGFILSILFVFAIRKALKKREKRLLLMLIVANFIAICSLFLTVFGLNNTVNQSITTISEEIVRETSPVIISSKIKKLIIDSGREQKNLFDDKHLANLRSLFFSNVLLFLAGIILILYVVEGKTQKIVVLLLFCFTSGAFSQFKVEEIYYNQPQSYSQWRIYSRLLHRRSYCIPVNHYPFLLSKNCDYLYFMKSEVDEYVVNPVKKVVLQDLASHSSKWAVNAVILVNKGHYLGSSQRLTLNAYDEKSKLLGTAVQLTPGNFDYIYFLFNKEIENPSYFVWKDLQERDITISPLLIVFGTYSDGSRVKIQY